jgi:hypothetical protein
MFVSKFKFPLLYDASDSAGTEPEAKSDLSKEDMIEFMKDEDSDDEEEEVIKLEKPKKEEKKTDDKEEDKESDEDKEEDEEDEEDEDLKALEEELEEPDDEKLELVTPVRRREILAKYPTLFKEFPYLERAYYREQAFTEIYPTVDEAKEALEKSQTLDNLEQSLLKGSSSDLLKSVKEHDTNSFYKIVDNYLPNLAEVDKDAYYHVLGTVLKDTVVSMVQESRKSQNDVLQSAAQVLHQFVFGSSEFEPAKPLAKIEDKKDNSIDEERRQFIKERFEVTKGELSTKIDNVLKSTISANIDPKDSMSDYVRRNATRDALEELQTLVTSDKRFKIILDKLWENAFKSNFSKSSVDSIKSAYLGRAKTLLPTVIKKARNEALKGTSRKAARDESNEDDSTEKVESKRRGHPAVGRTPNSSPKSDKEKAKAIPSNVRALDYLMSD